MITIDAVDLFCGVGGLTHGLVQAGINVRAGYDIDPDSAFAYEANNGSAVYIKKPVERVSALEIKSYLKSEYTMIAGCAPCQPFSVLNSGKKIKNKDWSLLGVFGDIAKEARPTFVTMENVPQLMKHHIYNNFLEILEGCGYHVSAGVVSCPDYGIPQQRKRLVLLASILGPIKILPPTHSSENYVTVRDAIGHLPPLEAGQSCPHDPLHWCATVSDLNLKRLKHSRPNGSWKDWPEELIANCHKQLRVHNYRSAYGRMSWDRPAPTITTQCHGISHGRFGHPEQDRPISLREAALLQTFPASYKFIEPGHAVVRSKFSRMIGNAVPVTLGTIIGQSFLKHVEDSTDV